MVCAWSMNSIPAGHTLKIRLTAALRNSAASMEASTAMERFLVDPRPLQISVKLVKPWLETRLAEWRRADTIGRCRPLSNPFHESTPQHEARRSVGNVEGGRALVGSRPEGAGATMRSEEFRVTPLQNAEEEKDLHGPSFLRLLKKAGALHQHKSPTPSTARYAKHH